MKRAWRWLVKEWLHISFWICVVCFFINVFLIELDLKLGLIDAAHVQMSIAGVCAVGALIQYLRALPDGPNEDE